MSKHEATVMINRPAQEVFERMLDLSKWGNWHPGHIAAQQTSDGSMNIGTTIREVFWLLPPFKGKAIYQVTALEPSRRFEYETLQSPVQAKIWYWLEPLPDGTRLTLGNQTQPSFGLRVFERIFPKMAQQMIESEAHKLKSFVEGSRI